MAWRPADSQVCMHTSAETWDTGSDYFYIASTLVTFCLPVILLLIPWWALLVQICGCCTRKLRSSEFWLSLMTIFMILFYEASRAPFELFNFHHILTNLELGQTLPIAEFLPLAESYKAVMKWAVYAPALLHPPSTSHSARRPDMDATSCLAGVALAVVARLGLM